MEANASIALEEGRSDVGGDQPVTPENILQVGFGFWGSKVLLSAVELGVFTALADEPLDAETLRERLDLAPRSARDFFDALVSLGILERQDGAYRNAPDTDRFLVRDRPSYIGGMLEMANERLYPYWADLTRGLRTGNPQNELKEGGENFFEVLYEKPDELRKFLRAMTGISMGASRAIAEAFPLRGSRNLRGYRHRGGGAPGSGGPRPRSHHRRRLRSSSRRAPLRALRGEARARRPATLPRR